MSVKAILRQQLEATLQLKSVNIDWCTIIPISGAKKIQMKQLLRFSASMILLCFAARVNAQEPRTEPSPQQPPVQQQTQLPRRVRMSQGVSERLIVKRVQPEYPQEARKKHAQGAVVLQVLIGKTGDVTNLSVLSGDGILSTSAVDAVKQWKYKPYVLNGHPIEVETQVTINYRLP